MFYNVQNMLQICGYCFKNSLKRLKLFTSFLKTFQMFSNVLRHMRDAI